MPSTHKTGYFRRRGWKDLIFLSVVAMLGLEARHLINMREAQKRISDHAKWERRPRISVNENQFAEAKPGESGLPPCFFISPPSPPDQKTVSVCIGDCPLLVPNGTR